MAQVLMWERMKVWCRLRSFVWHGDWFSPKIFNKCLLGSVLIMGFKLLWGQPEKPTLFSLIHGPRWQCLLKVSSFHECSAPSHSADVANPHWRLQLAVLRGLLNEAGWGNSPSHLFEKVCKNISHMTCNESLTVERGTDQSLDYAESGDHPSTRSWGSLWWLRKETADEEIARSFIIHSFTHILIHLSNKHLLRIFHLPGSLPLKT